MNTSQTTETEKPASNIQEERADLLNILARSMATEFFAENGSPSEPAIENQQLNGEPKVSPSEPEASPAESEPSPSDPGASPAQFPQEKRANLLNTLASRFAASSDAEKILSRENTEPPKYTALNSETDLKQPRNNTETDVKYSNFEPVPRPAYCPVPQVRGRFPRLPRKQKNTKTSGRCGRDVATEADTGGREAGDERAMSGR